MIAISGENKFEMTLEEVDHLQACLFAELEIKENQIIMAVCSLLHNIYICKLFLHIKTN